MDKKPLPKVYGVLGYPAKHSLSPLMHNAALRALKINAEYRIFERPPRELRKFLSTLAKENIRGLNVTVPYKEKVMPFLDSISREARLIRAVNTVLVRGKHLAGFNTDGAGFFRHLTGDLDFNPRGKTIAVIGAGGASKAVCVYLSQSAPKALRIFDIDKEKAGKLIRDLKKVFRGPTFECVDSIAGLNIKTCGLLVNATPIGMKKTDPPLVKAASLHKNLFVYDLIYNPRQTKLLAEAKKAGAKASNGLGMLLYQGALSFEFFTGRPAPIKVMRQALNKGVKTCC